jgi:hypothetical protein
MTWKHPYRKTRWKANFTFLGPGQKLHVQTKGEYVNIRVLNEAI